MADSIERDESLHLEGQTLDELHRKPVCESEAGNLTGDALSALKDPHAVRRCDSDHREFLNNAFPVED